jgi:uncharacterized protein YbjQ (UPF0145 family)
VGAVAIYVSPWVAGTITTRYYGRITQSLFSPRSTDPDSSQRALLDALGAQADALGANAVVAVEVTIDPFASRGGVSGSEWTAFGLAAFLERSAA